MKVLTKKLLTAFRVKMNTYYWELEKERRLTHSLEELVLHWKGSSQLFFFFKPKAKGWEGDNSKGKGPKRCPGLSRHVCACSSPKHARVHFDSVP